MSERHYPNTTYGTGPRLTADEKRDGHLMTLPEATDDLRSAPPRDVCDRAVDLAEDAIGAEICAVWLYDDADDVLRPGATSGYDRHASRIDACESLAWEAFANGEVIVHGDLRSAIEAPASLPTSPGQFVPLGRHGVFMVVHAHSEALAERDVDFVETLAATTTAALDGADRERRLRERERELERKSEAVERLEAVNAIVRDVDRAIVRAESREEIERGVCERLTADGRFTFAWIGEHDHQDGALVPREWAGDGGGYLDELAFAAGEDDPSEPGLRTADSRTPTVRSNVIDVLDDEAWATRALSAGFHAVASVPLAYGDVEYGVLSVYADRSSAFDDRLESVLADLGDSIAHAVHAMRRKHALLTDAVTELELAISDPDCPVHALARRADCAIEFRDVLSRPGDGVLALVTVPEAHLDAVLSAAEDTTVVETARPVGETGDGWLVQLATVDSLIAEDLADHGGRLESLTADAEGIHVCVSAPSTDPHAVVEMIQGSYPDAELLARRHDQEAAAPGEDCGRFWEQLTDRQREVAQLAFYGGYFERPRDHTGEELAERLDVSPQAFHKHLRRIQRTLFATTLEDGPETEG